VFNLLTAGDTIWYALLKNKPPSSPYEQGAAGHILDIMCSMETQDTPCTAVHPSLTLRIFAQCTVKCTYCSLLVLFSFINSLSSGSGEYKGQYACACTMITYITYTCEFAQTFVTMIQTMICVVNDSDNI